MTAAHVDVGDVELWVDRRGEEGPDVLLVAGLSDPAEAWELQLEGLADGYRLIAYDNRGAGRTPLPDGPLTVERLADDAAALLRALDVPRAHVLGFSGGSLIATDLAARYPALVRSLALSGTWADPTVFFNSIAAYWRRLAAEAESDRAMLEAFFLWVYTPRAHADGTVPAFIEEALAFAHPQSTEAFLAQLDAFDRHATMASLGAIRAPTLVLAGELDLIAPPRQARVVADGIAGARFELLPGEGHQPFQESADDFNARVDAFWREVDAAG